ncbi:unnamed protein product [Phytomonas sp. EM1]|nr:unnamed protein product [Phytomonas sp. EM1]|eukprot:CCW65867.1 unnamed protein product [Phytomonas sp. isolate EM1]
MTRQADAQRSMNKLSGNGQVEKVVELRSYDAEAVQVRMAKLRAEVAQKKLAELKKVEELSDVRVDDADVKLFATEMCLREDVARHKLQEKGGDLVAVLREAVNLPKIRF